MFVPTKSVILRNLLCSKAMGLRPIYTFLIFCACHWNSTVHQPAMAQKQPVSVIFDTDMGPDYDDVGALALLHALADQGEADILATVSCTRYEGVAAVLDVINTYFNRPHIPIGVAGAYGLTLRDWQHWTDSLRVQFPHSDKTNAAVASAVDLYRQILAAQPDNSITIVTVGFFSNIAALLQSAPDQHSDLYGVELIKQKVLKMVSMGGKFPTGREFNIYEDPNSAKTVSTLFPKPIIFSGFEIGDQIKTGLPLVKDTKIRNSPVQTAYRIGIAASQEDREGRQSWDQTAVLVAVKGHEPYFDIIKGSIHVQEDGTNYWNSDADHSSHFYLSLKISPQNMEEIINQLMMHQPTLLK